MLNDSPVIQIGFHENLIDLFQHIFNHVQSEKPGFHQICSGLVLQILGEIISLKRNENFKNNLLDKTLQKACLIIRDNTNVNVNIEQLAKDLKYQLFSIPESL